MISASICVFVSGQNPCRAVTRELAWPLLIRCVAGALAFITVTTALPLLPLVLFQVITNMTPFLAALLACLWLGEKLSFFQLVCMLLCFGGIAVVIFERDTTRSKTDKEFGSFNYGVILTCIVAMIFAVTAVTTRRVKGLHWSVVTFYFELSCFIISGLWILYEMRSQPVYQFKDMIPWMEIIGASFCHFTAQLFLTCMNQSLNPAIVAMFMYAKVVYAGFSDYFVFDEQLQSVQIVGAVAVLVLTIVAAIEKKLSADRAAAEKLQA